MPVGSPSFIVDSRTNVANVAKQHELATNETYPLVQASYMESITAESGGTRLQPMECARLVIGSMSGNHVMYIGGLEENAPYSGRGLPLYPGQELEREMFIENTNRVRICATFSGELVYYMGYINGTPTVVDPSTQGIQPNNAPPVLVRTDPLDRQENVEFRGSGNTFVAIFNENLASGTVDTSSMSIRLSGNFTSFLSGSTAYFEPESTDDRTKIVFVPASGELQGSSWYNVFIGQRIADDFGSTINSTLTWAFVTTGLDNSPMVLKTLTPASGSTLIPLNQTIEATFNKAISGIVNFTGYNTNIYLWVNSSGVSAGAVSGISILDDDTSGRKIIFTPNSLLSTDTLYRYTVSGIADSSENFAAPVSGVAFNTIPNEPMILKTWSPVSGSALVPFTQKIEATFNKAVSGFVNFTGFTNNIYLWRDALGVTAGAVSGISLLDDVTSGKKLTFTPNAQLSPTTLYRFSISGVADSSNNFISPISGVAFATAPADTQAPTISGIFVTQFISGNPSGVIDINIHNLDTAGGSANVTGVSIGTNVRVIFNEKISGLPGSQLSGAAVVSLVNSGAKNTLLSGISTLSVDQLTVSFDPDTNLSTGAWYEVRVSGVRDLSNNVISQSLPARSGVAFQTAALIDVTAPLVNSITPASGSVGNAIASNIVVNFSEEITGTAGTITGAMASGISVQRSGGAGSLAAAITLDAPLTSLTFNPSSDLSGDSTYFVSVSGILDRAGNELVPVSGHTFETIDNIPPVVSGITPASGTTVAANTTIVVTFSEAISGTANGTIAAGVTRLYLSGTPATVTSGVNTLNATRTQLTLTPNANLTNDQHYQVGVSGVMDASGNTIAAGGRVSGHSFLISAAVLPTVTAITPASGTIDVSTDIDPVVTFSEALTGVAGVSYTAAITRLYLSGTPASQVTHTRALDAPRTSMTITPSSPLNQNEHYQVGVSGAVSAIGNTMGAAGRVSGHSFQTQQGPIILSTNPASGASNVVLNSDIVVVFNKALSGTANGTVAAPVFRLATAAAPGTALGGTNTLNSDRTQLTFNPTADLLSNTAYVFAVSGVIDLNSNVITQTSPPRSGFAFTSITLDTTAPTITSTVPTSGATAIAVGTTFVTNFSEEISGTIGQQVGLNGTTSGIFKLWLSGSEGTPVHGVITKTATSQLTFTPNAALSGNRIYRAGVTGVFDLSQNVLNQNTGALRQSGFVFTTVDNIAPTVLSITPASGSTSVTVSQNVTITLSEPISGTVGTGTLTNTSAITCLATAGVGVGSLFPGTVNLDSTKTVVTFDQTGSWPSSTTFQIRVSGLRDVSDNFMVPVSGHQLTTAGVILTTFYDIAGTTERRFNDVSPVLFRVGVMRAASNSNLNAKVIKRASFKLKRTGTSNTTVFCRTIIAADEGGGDGGIAETIGSIAFNDIPTTATRVTFENLSATRALAGSTNANDCVVIEWNGATASADLTMYYDTNAFEGSDTHQVQQPTGNSWAYFEDRDTDCKLEG